MKFLISVALIIVFAILIIRFPVIDIMVSCIIFVSIIWSIVAMVRGTKLRLGLAGGRPHMKWLFEYENNKLFDNFDA